MEMQALSIDKGFMADDYLKCNMDEDDDYKQSSNDADFVDNAGKIKVGETDFSVERLLAGRVSNTEIVQEAAKSDLDTKHDKRENQTEQASLEIDICEFESLSNEEFQTSKIELFEDLEEQNLMQPSECTTLIETKSKGDFENIDEKIKVRVENDKTRNRRADDTLTEGGNLKSETLKTVPQMSYNSDGSEEYNDTCFDPDVISDTVEKKENLMRFAEVLYKCTLCTSIPSILTSKESFTKHITEQHLTHQQSFVDCPQCLLKFQTNEDLKEHRQLTHNTGSDITESSEFHDFTENTILSYDPDQMDRDDSDSHSSGHRSNIFVSNKSEEKKSGSKFNKEGITTCNGSLDLSLKNGCVEKSLKHELPEKDFNRNLPLLHQITDQIVKSSTPSRNRFENQRPIEFTPSYTPEFGKYTKLVREGGNIVYFCQVCNWKSPVKATFSVHCGIADHKRKVIMAERSEKGSSYEIDLAKISPVVANDSNCSKKIQLVNPNLKSISHSKEPVGWNPRGGASCLSLLSEPSGFYIGSKTGPVKSRTELCLNKQTMEKSHSVHRRKKTVINSIRHQMRLKPKWSDTDSDSDDNNDKLLLKGSENHREANPTEAAKQLFKETDKTKSMFDCHEEVNVHVNERLNKNTESSGINLSIVKKETDDTGKDDIEKDCQQVKHLGLRDLGEPVEKKQKLSLHTETSIQNLIDKHVLENIKAGSEIVVLKLYKCHLCDFEYSDLKEYGNHFDEVHKSLSSPENLDVDQSVKKANDRSNTGTPNVELGEHWRVQKLKELLPGLSVSALEISFQDSIMGSRNGISNADTVNHVHTSTQVMGDYVKVSTKSNVSRDLLLQRISAASGITEMVGWSSACNKAMREIFPSSLAQRKGKYKKTFYFGMSLSDEASHEDEVNVATFVGDPDSLAYQPIRDLNVDIEKLLEHLPTILLWTGDMDKGVYRDDVLQNLAEILDEHDVKFWGKQCNKAIRVVFPNVEIKRKGKDKTSVYFGLDFFDYSHSQHFEPKLAGKLKEMDPDTSDNNSKTAIKAGTEEPLNLVSAWTKGSKSYDNFQVDEYLAKFGGVSMFDSNEEDNEDLDNNQKSDDSDNDHKELCVTKNIKVECQ